MKILVLISLFLFTATSGFTADCTKEDAKKAVETVCTKIKDKGAASKKDIAKFRFCGTNYVWVQDSSVKMVLHPIKPRLNGKDLTSNKDEKGKKLFVEFDKKAKAEKNGGWVSYFWTKPGAEKASPKTSFVKMCEGSQKWIAGAGVWNN